MLFISLCVTYILVSLRNLCSPDNIVETGVCFQGNICECTVYGYVQQLSFWL